MSFFYPLALTKHMKLNYIAFSLNSRKATVHNLHEVYFEDLKNIVKSARGVRIFKIDSSKINKLILEELHYGWLCHHCRKTL